MIQIKIVAPDSLLFAPDKYHKLSIKSMDIWGHLKVGVWTMVTWSKDIDLISCQGVTHKKYFVLFWVGKSFVHVFCIWELCSKSLVRIFHWVFSWGNRIIFQLMNYCSMTTWIVFFFLNLREKEKIHNFKK